ncbi:MAG: hormogonium polysaccharide biosynthesis protein HpsA [Microcoleus vaginatus WJT46-NPBG5]|jgi:type II secretory pathway pseudopilin PulG|nr:hormogonium polysaccharide biosynthesis protein HpsA [Microcoleus vaginatus WJT46-NPBG5]
MAKHKFNTTFARLLREIVKLFKTLTGQFMRWFLRTFLVGSRRGQRQAGFVLPTIAFMLMVLALVVGALMFRTFNRTNQVISERQQQAIVNAATPAIDRAKSKLEYLFTKGELPAGVPNEEEIENLLLDDNRYTFPGEERIPLDLGNGPATANAWKFETDTNGDGKVDATTIYTIASRAERTVGGTIQTINPGNTASSANYLKSDTDKAKYLLTRNGPLAAQSTSTDPECQVAGANSLPGWFDVGSAQVFKAFQVYAVTVPNASAQSQIKTLQYQQDRAFERGNKWGAWFRYDWELYPGDGLKWNGAVHTEGTLFIASGNQTAPVESELISQPASCFYKPDANSSITAGNEFVRGRIRDNNFNTGSQNLNIYLYEGGPVNLKDPGTGDSKQDFVAPGSSLPIDISSDPLTLLTRNIATPRTLAANDGGDQNAWRREEEIETNELLKDLAERIKVGERTCPPYVDDTYRADNRFGPKVSNGKEVWNEKTERCESKPTGKLGTVITAADESATGLKLIQEEPPETEPDNMGLDGYWERRARNEGLRIIVGQRLELGNTFGWVDATEPLYPPENGAAGVNPGLGNDRRNEGRQYRTLRDNLAAVQTTAIYHHTNQDGYFPTAYVATTVHPGTINTLTNSSTVKKPVANFAIATPNPFTGNQFGNDSDELIIDFFTGLGTNGLEFNTYDAANFATKLGTNQPLGKALRNLAYFAGDPEGAFLPVQETAGSQIHPDPKLTMWGNFSNLRDTLKRLDAGTSYASLSIADKSNIHTAAGTLGMLAYNISYLEKSSIPPADVTALGAALVAASPTVSAPPTPDKLIAKLQATPGKEKEAEQARILHLKEQIARDRTDGFKTTGGTYSCTLPSALAPHLCAKPQTPKFPSLYYLFPKTDHAHSAGGPSIYVDDAYIKAVNGTAPIYKVVEPTDPGIVLKPRTPAGATAWKLPSPAAEASSSCDTDAKLNFNVGSGPAFESKNYIRLYTSATAYGCLRVPFKDSALFDGREMMSVRALNIDLDLLRDAQIGSQDTWLPDKGLVYAFREDAVREDAIVRPSLGAWGDTTTGYRKAWNDSKGDPTEGSLMDVFGNGLAAGANPADPPVCFINPSDPKLDPNNPNYDLKYDPCTAPPSALDRGLSPKSVDYYADPDRRPYGFRLKNGKDLTRSNTLPAKNNLDAPNRNGMSFISDNPVYIQGNFNLHSSNGNTTNLSEFNGTNRNTNFAQVNSDHWRPSEIITDAVNILSSNFCDGTIDSGIVNPNDKGVCPNANQRSSYQNSHMWATNPAATAKWECENPDPDAARPTTAGYTSSCIGPIKVSRNGEVKLFGTPSSTVYTSYRKFEDKRQLTEAVETTVNGIMVSGIVPSRQNQGNGGFQNFPRLNEYWGGTNLNLSGSMIQLNFSNYATAPYDQDAWEPSLRPGTNERINYYIQSTTKPLKAPTRKWGYDVGLQFQSAGPVAKRMVTPASERSEFYREPPADDPYICKLRKVINPSLNCGG